jgi:hypothetical protein
MTKKFLGKNSLIDRLAAQVGNRDMAMAILKDRGHVDAKGNLTEAGRARDAMTAEERAKDRAATRSGKPAKAYAYDPNTNRATLKRR